MSSNPHLTEFQLRAIRARIVGAFDDPELRVFGALSTDPLADIRHILDTDILSALTRRADDLGFEIVKDTESDYYRFKARFWVEDSPATFDTLEAAALACVQLYGG